MGRDKIESVEMNAIRLTEWRVEQATKGEGRGSPAWNAIIINKAPFTHNSNTMNEYLLSSLVAVAVIATATVSVTVAVTVIATATVAVSVTLFVSASANNTRCVLITPTANGIDGFNQKSPQFVALAINDNCLAHSLGP